jgi:hypothetical protein
MTYRIKLLNLMFLGLLIAGSAVAQVIPTRPPRTNDPNRPDPATQRWYDELRKRENMPTGIGAINNRTVVAAAINEIYEHARKKLAPTADEKRIYVDFLKQSNTGIIRIAATVNCKYILDVTQPDQECYNQYIPGSALAFSFRRADYSHNAYSDLKRVNDDFVLPGTFVLGLITSIGDIPIESIGTDNVLVTDLAGFSPASEINEVAGQDFEIIRGLKIGDLIYRKTVPIREHTTYLLRSVAYRAKFLNLPKSESKRGSLDEDERSDVTVVFRIVRKGADDTYLLLWREVARIPSPLLTVDVAKR